jgi:HSP20 family protein
MNDIDRTIEGVEQLYRSLTGKAPGNGESPHEVIPPETDPTRYVEQQMDRLLSLLGTSPREHGPRAAWTPPISLWEAEDAYVALVDLPGVSRDSVKVSVSGNGLLVQAARTAPNDEIGRARVRYQEHALGTCQRFVPLPADASLEQVEARMNDGSLTLRVPRTPAARGRSIEVH